MIVYEVKELRIGTDRTINCGTAATQETSGWREISLKLIEVVPGKVLTPCIPQITIISTQVIALAFIPVVVTGNEKKVGDLFEQISSGSEGVFGAAFVLPRGVPTWERTCSCELQAILATLYSDKHVEILGSRMTHQEYHQLWG